MVTVLWQTGELRLELHQDGGDRAVVLVDGGQLVGVWKLPPRASIEANTKSVFPLPARS